MKLALIGSQSYTNYDSFYFYVDSFSKKYKVVEIVSGGAPGADSLAERYAKDNNLTIKTFYAEWDKYGNRAGYLRNNYIIEYADYILAFWDGESPGTKHSINLAKKRGKDYQIISI